MINNLPSNYSVIPVDTTETTVGPYNYPKRMSLPKVSVVEFHHAMHEKLVQNRTLPTKHQQESDFYNWLVVELPKCFEKKNTIEQALFAGVQMGYIRRQQYDWAVSYRQKRTFLTEKF